MPPQVKAVPHWYGAGRPPGVPNRDMIEFAGKFLRALRDDGAVVPETSAPSAPLTHSPAVVQKRVSRRPHPLLS